MGGIFGGSPSIPAPPPPPPPPAPPPTPVDAAVTDAGTALQQRAQAASGLASTDPTGPQGLTVPPPTTKSQLKSLLGN